MGTYNTSDQVLRVATDRIGRLQHEAQQRRLAESQATDELLATSRRPSVPVLGWSRRALALVGR